MPSFHSRVLPELVSTLARTTVCVAWESEHTDIRTRVREIGGGREEGREVASEGWGERGRESYRKGGRKKGKVKGTGNGERIKVRGCLGERK